LNYPKSLGNNRWIIEVKGSGGVDEELYIELPPRVLHQMGWDVGDSIEWVKQDDGKWLLQKVTNE
jgi:hypothetical protein